MNRLVISGHSHGGAMAEMNAIDAISNWKCGKRKLMADDISVVLIAPHHHFMPMKATSDIWSCGDKSKCLAGSVVTLVNRNDPVANGTMFATVPAHPSAATELPCNGMPEGVKTYTSEAAVRHWWCHDLKVYASNVEDVLVDGQQWGSTCNGQCGEMNRQLQCGEWHSSTKLPCTAAQPADLGVPTNCSGGWKAKEEKCECLIDRCDQLVTHGCS